MLQYSEKEMSSNTYHAMGRNKRTIHKNQGHIKPNLQPKKYM